MHRQFWITAVMRWAGLEMPPPFVPVCHFGLTRTCGGLSPQVFLASLRPLARTERMPKMKIRVKHYSWDESKAPVVTVVEVPEGDCQIMIERDYELRKQAAKEGEEVTRRSAQEIMNEDFNKPLYNDWHREHRRRSEFPNIREGMKKISAWRIPSKMLLIPAVVQLLGADANGIERQCRI